MRYMFHAVDDVVAGEVRDLVDVAVEPRWRRNLCRSRKS